MDDATTTDLTTIPPGFVLTERQKLAIDLAGRVNVCLQGPAGSGKSFVVDVVRGRMEAMGKSVAVTAMTGTAAKRIGGVTLHGWAGIGIGDRDAEEYCRMASRPFSKAGKRIRTASLLILDECSMMSVRLFELLDKVMRRVRKAPDVPFGGVLLLFSGDVRQLHPVSRKGDPADLVKPFTESLLFERAFCGDAGRVIILDKNHRQGGDLEYATMLERIGLGNHTQSDLDSLQECVDTSDIDVQAELRAPRVMPTIFGTNKRADDVNQAFYEALGDVEEHEYNSSDIMEPEKGVSASSVRGDLGRLMDQLRRDSRFPETTCIKLGQYVTLLKNIDTDKGWTNGTMCTVVAFSSDGFPVVCRDRERALQILGWQTTQDNGDVGTKDKGDKSNETQVGTGDVEKKRKQSTEDARCAKRLCGVGGVAKGISGDGDTEPDSSKAGDEGCDCNETEKEVEEVSANACGDDDHPDWTTSPDCTVIRPVTVEEMRMKYVGCVYRVAIPVRHARGITVHRAQGATFDESRMDLGRDQMFAMGQVYVALSRVRSKSGVHIMGSVPRNIMVSNTAKAFYKKYG